MRNLTARDIMHADILFAYEGWSIKYLGEFFRKHQIAGAPVIASDHSLVGVVSITDVFHFENANREHKLAKLKDYYQESYALDFHEKDLESWSLTAEESCTVHQIMNPKVITVAPDASLKAVCATLVENSIHRVFVTDKQQIAGVIASSDVLKVLADTL